jgi:protein TonB
MTPFPSAAKVLPLFVLFSFFAALPAGAVGAQQETEPAPKIIRKAGGVLAGAATKRVEPVYPPLAKAARISGAVVVEITIDEAGKVIAAHAVTGHALLKDAAVAAAGAWEFHPTLLQGTPVKGGRHDYIQLSTPG